MGRSLALPIVLLAVCLAVVCTYRPARAAAIYSISQLDELTNIGFAYGSSADRSKIAGRITVGSNSHAFVHSSGVLTDLGVTGGFPNSQARDVNDLGQAVGLLSNTIGGGIGTDRAFVFTGGAMTQLPTLNTGTAAFTHAYAINNAGRIVGASGDKPFVYTIGDAALTELPTFSVFLNAKALSINESGTIVGFHGLSGAPGRAAVWRNGALTFLAEIGFFSEATFINDAEVIIGRTFYGGFTTSRATIFDEASNTATDLGTLGGNSSEAFDVNSFRQVIGSSRTGVGFSTAPFLWENGTMVNLNSLLPPASGWVLTRAISINDAGEITGLGTFNGTPSGFRLTPIPEPAAAITALAVLGVTGIVRRPRQAGL